MQPTCLMKNLETAQLAYYIGSIPGGMEVYVDMDGDNRVSLGDNKADQRFYTLPTQTVR